LKKRLNFRSFEVANPAKQAAAAGASVFCLILCVFRASSDSDGLSLQKRRKV